MQDDLVRLLAGRRGHFRMESGYHSEQWFDLDRLFERPERLQPFVSQLASGLQPHRIDAVCGPMTGGAKLAALIAAELDIPYLFADRFEPAHADRLFPIKYELPVALREKVRGRSVAIVDDAISAGSAVRGTHADLLACGARVAALGALVVFGNTADRFAADHGLALVCVARMQFGMWKPDDCPLCRTGLPLEEVSDAKERRVRKFGPTREEGRPIRWVTDHRPSGD